MKNPKIFISNIFKMLCSFWADGVRFLFRSSERQRNSEFRSRHNFLEVSTFSEVLNWTAHFHTRQNLWHFETNKKGFKGNFKPPHLIGNLALLDKTTYFYLFGGSTSICKTLVWPASLSITPPPPFVIWFFIPCYETLWKKDHSSQKPVNRKPPWKKN